MRSQDEEGRAQGRGEKRRREVVAGYSDTLEKLGSLIDVGAPARHTRIFPAVSKSSGKGINPNLVDHKQYPPNII